MKMMVLLVPTLLLAACGSAAAPQDHEPLVDGRGGHAGTFNARGDGNGAAAADDNASTQGGNSQ